MITYRMRCQGDCGPAAIAFATGIDQDTVERVMDWQHYHDNPIQALREDLQDSPWHHFAAIVKLGQTFILRSCRDVMTGVAKPNKTIILLHPDARHALRVQHWVVLAGHDPDGVVKVHWGDGTIRRIPDFEEWYSRGTPACAYEVAPTGGQRKLTWYQRLYVWLTGRFA